MNHIEAMKLALEALEHWMRIDTVEDMHIFETVTAPEAIAVLRKALEQEPWDTTDMAHRPNGLSMEQSTECVEPVAWLSRDDARLALWDAINKREFGNPTDDKLILDHLRKNGLWIGKYTSPPASKPWVGLTDVEWMNIVNKDHAWFGQRPEDVAHEVAKLVEAKLKEKNT